MFANIRRHQRWLWYVISAAVIISFTWYLNPSNRGGGRGGMFEGSVGTINGRQISRTEYLDTLKEAELKYLINYGSWHGSDEFSRQNPDFVNREAKQRLFLKEKIRDFGIEATPAEVAEWIQERIGREKGFTEAQYDELIKTIGRKNISEADLNRFIRTELGIMHLLQVAGVSGQLVTPQEAEAQYRRENEQVSAEAIFFTATNFVDQVKVDPAALSRFYTNQQAMYRVPEKLQVSYLAFPATNYYGEADKLLASITNLSQRIDQAYAQRGTNYYTDTNGMVMTPEAAKAKIREDERRQIGLVEARKAANDFAEALLGMPGAKDSANLEKLATERGLKVQVSEPFSQFESPRGIEVPEKFSQLAFTLNPSQPFIEEPVVGTDAVYVVALKNRIPSNVPALESVTQRVTEDYKRLESRTIAHQAGQEFYAKLTNAVAAGKPFTAAAAELGRPVVSIAPFSQMSRSIPGLDPRVDVSTVKSVAFSLKENETSSFIPTRDGGFVLHVNKFIPATDSEIKAALPEYLANLRRSGQNEAFSEWFSKEFQGARLSLVNDKQSGQKGALPESDTQ